MAFSDKIIVSIAGVAVVMMAVISGALSVPIHNKGAELGMNIPIVIGLPTAHKG